MAVHCDIEDKQMSLWEHLEELRWVILKALLAVVLASGISLIFTEWIYSFLLRPLRGIEHQVELIFAAPLDAFLIKMKLALLGGCVLALPIVLAFIWNFIAPGLKRNERQAVWFGVCLGSLFFCCGVAFGYFLLPYGLPLLIGFGSADIRQLWPLSVYINFCFRLLLGFGVVFQMPVVLMLLVRLQLLKTQTLVRNRVYAAIAILFIAAVLTPPDFISQVVLAGPMLLLYELSIIAGRWQEKRLTLQREPGDE